MNWKKTKTQACINCSLQRFFMNLGKYLQINSHIQMFDSVIQLTLVWRSMLKNFINSDITRLKRDTLIRNSIAEDLHELKQKLRKTFFSIVHDEKSSYNCCVEKVQWNSAVPWGSLRTTKSRVSEQNLHNIPTSCYNNLYLYKLNNKKWE